MDTMPVPSRGSTVTVLSSSKSRSEPSTGSTSSNSWRHGSAPSMARRVRAEEKSMLLSAMAWRRPAVPAEDARAEADAGGDQRIVVGFEIERERLDARAAHAERGDGLEDGGGVGRPDETEATRDAGRAAEPVERVLGTGREIIRPEQRLRQFQPVKGVDLGPAPHHSAQRGVSTHGRRSLRAAVPSRRVPAIWARRAAFSAIIASLPRPSIAGLDAGVSEPTASEYLR